MPGADYVKERVGGAYQTMKLIYVALRLEFEVAELRKDESSGFRDLRCMIAQRCRDTLRQNSSMAVCEKGARVLLVSA